MKNRFLKSLSLIAASLLASASLAHAAGLKDFYFAGYMGLNVPKLSQRESAPPMAQALGFKLGRSWRIEGELSERAHLDKVSFNEADSPVADRFKNKLGLVNIYHDFGSGKVKPFIGAGAGFATRKVSSEPEESGFAWQVGGGVTYNINPLLSFSSAYRMLDESSSSTGFADRDSASQELHLGIQYKLPIKPKHHPRGLNDMGRR
jgi:opacity protein-like surface antigen